jgi:hypothetical protein
VLVAALLLTPACGSGTSPSAESPSPDSTSVEQQWFVARADAQRQGTENLVSFYDAAVVIDHRAIGPEIVRGREEALRMLERRWARDSLVRVPDGAPFLSPEGAVTLEHLGVANGRMTQILFQTRFGPQGATSEAIARSELGWRALDPGDERMVGVHALTADYVAGWSGRDKAAIGGHYAQDASLEDGLLGVHAAGTAITDLAAEPLSSGGLAGMTLAELPDFGGPAVFAAGSTMNNDPMDGIALILTTPEGAACPQQVAVWLQLDPTGRIDSETRYHRLADLAGCHPAVDVPTGWWQTLAIPEPIKVVLTGTINAGRTEVEVYNGSPELDALLQWGVGRLESVGLTVPTIGRVTFYAGQVDRCEGIAGLIQGDAISLCFNTATACAEINCTTWRSWTRATLLHELGHAWMAQNLAAATIDQFLEQADMRTWAGSDAAWADRGVELAAETLAWALMDEPYQVRRQLGPRTCDELAALYEILTGSRPEPMPGCPDTG